jgi:hypothetical protein
MITGAWDRAVFPDHLTGVALKNRAGFPDDLIPAVAGHLFKGPVDHHNAPLRVDEDQTSMHVFQDLRKMAAKWMVHGF